MSTKTLTYGDLPHPSGFSREQRLFLFCRKCGSHYSADRRDYFWQPAGSRVTCSNGHLGSPMILAHEERRIVGVTA